MRQGLRHLVAGGLISLSAACVAAQEGRYILYLEPSLSQSLQHTERQSETARAWGKQLDGEVRFERQLGTGGWVVIVTNRAASLEQQETQLKAISGVETVERDALMRIR